MFSVNLKKNRWNFFKKFAVPSANCSKLIHENNDKKKPYVKSCFQNIMSDKMSMQSFLRGHFVAVNGLLYENG